MITNETKNSIWHEVESISRSSVILEQGDIRDWQRDTALLSAHAAAEQTRILMLLLFTLSDISESLRSIKNDMPS